MASIATSSLSVALALTLLVLANDTEARSLVHHDLGDLCKRADFPTICREITKGQKDPRAAVREVVKKLATETAAAKKAAAAKRGATTRAQVIGVCIESYDEAQSSLAVALSDMEKRDKGGFNSELSAALTDFSTCDDSYVEMGMKSPFAATNSHLRHLASTGLYLASLLH